jgi:hypothetical protein
MTSRSDRQCFTFQRQASPKESSFRLNVNRLPFFEKSRSPHKRELPGPEARLGLLAV